MKNFDLREFAKTHDIIFYGAGNYASAVLSVYTSNGIIPVCFADRDENKHNRVFSGEFIIYSVKDAMLKFPEAYILVTVDPDKSENVIDTLISSGTVQKDRLLNLRFEKYLSCAEVQNKIIISTARVIFCCFSNLSHYEVPGIDIVDDDYNSIADRTIRLQSEVLDDLRNGGGKYCRGCKNIYENHWVFITGKLECVGITGMSSCNANCFYCDRSHLPPHNFVAVPIIRRLIETDKLDKGVRFDLAGGEITIQPNAEDFYSIVDNYNAYILSSGILYSERIHKLISRKDYPYTLLFVSIDSGTRESYKKIKRVDKFDVVRANLIKYAENGGRVRLKYIILTGINDNYEDADGFLEICRAVRPESVVLSYNFCEDISTLGEKAYEIRRYIRKCAENEGFTVADLFPANVTRNPANN
jgi:wyosine [tRNA(Phe)-imidazoG37] synthetase (radical SAM superfamily)